MSYTNYGRYAYSLWERERKGLLYLKMTAILDLKVMDWYLKHICFIIVFDMKHVPNIDMSGVKYLQANEINVNRFIHYYWCILIFNIWHKIHFNTWYSDVLRKPAVLPWRLISRLKSEITTNNSYRKSIICQ